jgi:hypothetical protein
VSNSPIIQINVKKTHLMAIAILLLIGAATSTVNIRDTTKMFDRLDMDGNPITNLQDPNNPQDAATKSYVDNNAGSGGGLDWSSAQPVHASGPAEIDCGSGEVLRDVTCSVIEDWGTTTPDPEEPTSCDTRTEQSASLASGTQEQSHVYGTCVPVGSGSTGSE